MSTDFLNRRMDLKHTSSFENHLTMDTSYPVKLAGKVMKLFTASSDFNTNKWILENSDKEVILTVESDNVYDFAGRVIKDNVGITKAYTTNKDVFKQDDYVMVIIDFDNKKILLCSESNFKNFITGEDISSITSNIRMYTIDGDTEVEGFDYPIDTDIFDTAAEYEAETDRYALVRSDVDKVVYESPTNKDGSRDMVPVSNVDTININSLNVSIQNLVFPFIDFYFTDSGFENIKAIHSYSTINGAVNDEFIEEFCFTEEELLNLPFFNKNQGNSHQEYNNISGDKSKYYYVLNSRNGGNYFKNKVFDQSMMFTPISISNKKFSIFYDFANDGIVVGNNKVGISAKGYKPTLIGNYFTNDRTNGFYVFNYGGPFKRIMVDNFIDNTNQYPYDLFIEKNRDFSNMGWANIRIGDNTWRDSVFNDNSEMVYVKRFVNFFAIDGYYYNHIKSKILMLANDTIPTWFPVFSYDDSPSNIYDKSIKNIVIIYPEVFDNVLFDKDSSGNFCYESEKLYNYTSFHNNTVPDDNFDRTKYIASQFMLCERSEIQYLLYILFNKNLDSGYVGTSYDSTIRTQSITNIGDVKLKFKLNVPILGGDGSHQYIVKDINGNNILATIITRVNVTNLNRPYESEKPYNVAQFGVQDILVTKEIKFVDEYIKYENDEYKIYPDGFDTQGQPKGEGYVLYIAVNENGTITMKKLIPGYFKNNTNIGTDVTGIMYMYYKQGTIIKRIKYYYKNNDVSVGTGQISKYDYYTTFENLFDVSQVYDTSNCRNRTLVAFLNQYMIKNNVSIETALSVLNNYLDDNNDLSISPSSNIITEVIKTYKIYPVNDNSSDSYNVEYNTLELGGVNTCNLTEDYRDDFAASINDKTINDGAGFRLKDLIDDYYTIAQNPLAPHVSKTKKDGQFIYNIKTYNDYLKSTPVSDLFYTEEFPYINGVGIREEYYKGKSLYEFYLYILTRNLAIPIDDDSSWLINTSFNSANRLFYTKSEVEKVKDIILIYNEEENKYYDTFVDENNNPIEIESKLSLHNNINIKSLFGLNDSDLVDSEGNDVMDDYSSEDVILVNKEQAGVKSVYSVPMSDGDPNIPVILSINGVMDDIEVDKITWETLLLALHNNKTIDILSKPLIQIKTDLNDCIYLTGQNINDTISIEDNITDEDANNHDTIYDYNESDPESPTKEFKRQHYKEHNAEFDEKHNIYDFNFGYGFTDNKRELNNRGVIVFVSDGAETRCNQTGHPSNPENWIYDFTEGNVYPKRMYVSKDGIICTKEYYYAENDDDPSGGGSGSDIMTFNKIVNIISEMQNQYEENIDEIAQYIFNNVEKTIEFDTVVMDEEREEFMYMLSDTNDDTLTYTSTYKYKVYESGNKLIVDDTLGEEHEFIAGEALINGIPYVFAPNGVLKPGWQSVGSNSGALKIGNIPISDKRYYYDYDTGNIQLGWVEWQGNKFYITLLEGKLTSQYRTFSEDGTNVTYWFDEAGIATEVDDMNLQEEIINLQKLTDSLNNTIEILSKSVGMTDFKIMRNKISSAINAVLICHYTMAYKVNDGSWLVDIKAYYRNMQYIYEDIDAYTEQVHNVNNTLNNLLAMHHPNYAKIHTSRTDTVFDELYTLNDSFKTAVENAEALADKKSAFKEYLMSYMNYIVDNLTNDVKDTNPNLSDIKNTVSNISFE